MALTLQQIRDYVYEHLELDEDDVPTNLIDVWATEGFLRIVKVIRRWPHFQQEFSFETVAAQQAYPKATTFQNAATIASIQGPNGEMAYDGHQEQRQRYFRTSGATTPSGRPQAYSKWADTFYLWPTPDGVYDIDVMAYREPTIFGSDPGAEPDLPEQFHQLVRSWVLYRAYLHQDDTELAEIEKIQFSEILDMFVKEFTRDDGSRPMIYGGSKKPARMSGDMLADYSTWSN